VAALVERVEALAEHDAEQGRGFDPERAIAQALERYPGVELDAERRELLRRRHRIFWSAAAEHPDEAGDVVVRRRRRIGMRP
jgi:hypothetical protein